MKEVNEIAYGRFVVDSQTKYNLKSLCSRLGIDKVTDEFHSTVLYSRDNIDRLLSYSPSVVYPIECTIKGFKLLGENENCLVAELDSPDLYNVHNELKELGANWDYPEFTPHITLSYNWKKGKEISCKLPKFKVKLKTYKSERSSDDYNVTEYQLEESNTMAKFNESLNRGKIISWASKYKDSKERKEKIAYTLQNSGVAELTKTYDVVELLKYLVKLTMPEFGTVKVQYDSKGEDNVWFARPVGFTDGHIAEINLTKDTISLMGY